MVHGQLANMEPRLNSLSAKLTCRIVNREILMSPWCALCALNVFLTKMEAKRPPTVRIFNSHEFQSINQSINQFNSMAARMLETKSLRIIFYLI